MTQKGLIFEFFLFACGILCLVLLWGQAGNAWVWCYVGANNALDHY
jgi:hypothetical protein